MITVPFDAAPSTDSGPAVEHVIYTMPDGSTFKATISRTILGRWVAAIWDDRTQRVWVSPLPFKSRPELLRRCTEEVDREFRRRMAG